MGSTPLEAPRQMYERGELHPAAPHAAEIELDEEFRKNAVLVMPRDRPKTPVHLRIDPEVFDRFRRRGKGHLTRMNAVLRVCDEANRKTVS